MANTGRGKGSKKAGKTAASRPGPNQRIAARAGLLPPEVSPQLARALERMSPEELKAFIRVARRVRRYLPKGSCDFL